MATRMLRAGPTPFEMTQTSIFSGRRFDGYFVRVRYTVESYSGMHIEVTAIPTLTRWTVPPAEWDRVGIHGPVRPEWRDPAARPGSPLDEPWVGHVRWGVAERVGWWRMERDTILAARFILTGIDVHPTDTSLGVCEESGRQMVDDVVERLTQAVA